MTEMLQILTLIAAFGFNADARNWEAAQSAFAPQVQVDYTSLFGGTAQTLASADLIKSWQSLLPGFTRTQHTIGVPLIEVKGRTARASAPFVAYHFIDDPAPNGGGTWIVGGRYEWTLQKLDGRWRITQLVLAAGWQDGNRELAALAAQRAKRP